MPSPLSTPALAVTALILAVCPVVRADDEDPFDTERKGTKVELWVPEIVARGEAFEARVTFRIPKGYHIYGPVVDGVANPKPTQIEALATDGLVFGTPRFPPVHKGPFLDEVLKIQVTHYVDQVTVVVPVTVKPKARFDTREIKIKVEWGTCSESSCLAGEPSPETLVASTRIALARPSLVLPKATVHPGEEFELEVVFEVPAPNHIYGPEVNEATTPTQVEPQAVDAVTWEAAKYPVSTPAGGDHSEYKGTVRIPIRGKIAADAAPGPRRIVVLASWGTCDEQSCYEFARRHPIAIELTVAKP